MVDVIALVLNALMRDFLWRVMQAGPRLMLNDLGGSAWTRFYTILIY